MSIQTRYEATETGVDIVTTDNGGWRKSFTYPGATIGDLTWENIASLLNCAYQRGSKDQQTEILKALGVK